MAFRPFEVTVPHVVYTALGGFIVLFGMFSLFIKERAYIGEAPIATIVGIILGPHVAGVFDPSEWGGPSEEVTDEITLEVTRVIIAVSVFAVGVELPKAYMKKHWRTLFFLLGPCMLWGWMISALLMWGLMPKLNFLSCLLIAASVTPTDPILAQAVIGGKFADKHVPAHVRHMLSAESGSNDGAAFPFLGIALYLTLDSSPGHAVGHWIYYTVLYEVALGIVLGALLGWVARKIMKFSEAKRLIDRQSYVAQYISLAVLSIGFTSLLGSDDLLSAFACGCAFAWDGFFNKATEDAVFSNVIDLLFNCTAFIYIGAIIPFKDFDNHEIHMYWWRLLILAILILLLRRLPIILALYKFIPDIKTFREAIFTGWFGPMGVGAIFIGTLSKTSLPEGEAEENTEQVDLIRESILPIVSFLVLSSIVTHGLSIPFFSLSRRVHSITNTWSRQPSMDGRNEPAWTTHMRRIIPGQDIVINRDEEDGVQGDLGIRRVDHGGEKESEGSRTSSSRTAAGTSAGEGEEHIEMTEQGGQHSGEHNQSGRENAPVEDDDGSNTPPLAEYREGNHLVIERRRGSGNEVEVEVIRNHFAESEGSIRTVFKHPERLGRDEMDRIRAKLRQWEAAAAGLTPRSSRDNLSLSRTNSRPLSRTNSRSGQSVGELSRTSSHSSDGARAPQYITNELTETPREQSESDHEEQAPEPRSRLPAIKVNDGKKKPGLRQRLFGRRKEESPDAGDAEEGRASEPHDPTFLSPNSRSSRAPVPIIATDSVNNEDNALSPVISRGTAIRFAPGSSMSSDTAPGNYGSSNPSFKRNPSLAMYRSASIASVQSTGSQRETSVSFAEPTIKR